MITSIKGKTINIRIPFLSLFSKTGNYLYLFFLVVAILPSYSSCAQNIPPQDIPPKIIEDSLEKTDAAYWDTQRDLGDIAKKIVKKDTSTLHKHHKVYASCLPAVGYSLQTKFAVVLSSNFGFYTNPKHSTEKISTVLSSIAYTQQRQIIFPIQTSIWTKKDKYNIITDWKYLNYPSTTFGLGGNSKIIDGYSIDFNYLRFHQSLLRKIANYTYAGLGYYYDYFWDIREINPPKGAVTDFQKYGLSKTTRASGIAFRLLVDTRKNQINAKQGWYINIVNRQNLKSLGSTTNWESFLAEFRHYITFPAHPKNVLALWSYNWLTIAGKPPYLLLPSTGWDDYFNTGRGYIQGRYRGRQMLYMEAEYRMQITKNGLLGAVFFANAQSFSKDLSRQFQTIAPAAGAGIRIKLNKFSGANLCIDYAFGAEGSRGFFVNLGEVF